jgi:hypothetical protein
MGDWPQARIPRATPNGDGIDAPLAAAWHGRPRPGRRGGGPSRAEGEQARPSGRAGFLVRARQQSQPQGPVRAAGQSVLADGVLVEAAPDRLRLVATDNRRRAVAELPAMPRCECFTPRTTVLREGLG